MLPSVVYLPSAQAHSRFENAVLNIGYLEKRYINTHSG